LPRKKERIVGQLLQRGYKMTTKQQRIDWLNDCKQFCMGDDTAISHIEDFIDDILNEEE
jgi:hypothetical protein